MRNKPLDKKTLAKRRKAIYQAQYWLDNKERLRERNALAHKKFLKNNPNYMNEYMYKYYRL